jgi:ABC-type bacteriocin/lantibiotic exporter with double-glycine peptidase domain
MLACYARSEQDHERCLLAVVLAVVLLVVVMVMVVVVVVVLVVAMLLGGAGRGLFTRRSRPLSPRPHNCGTSH